LSSSRDDYANFQVVDTEIIGISANLSFSQSAFADFLKLNFPLVSDYPELKTIEVYGVLDRERRLAQRSYFIVDSKVLFVTRMSSEEDSPVSNDALVAEIKKIQ
jgi:peroxiredoxin